jgi:hypothetical protein
MRSRTERGPWSAIAVPWLAYLAVTVLGPALNGATRQPEFWEHAVITTVVSTSIAALWLWIARIPR